MAAARCRACKRRLSRPSPDGLGPVCRRARQPQTARPTQLELPASVPAADGQLALAFEEPAPRAVPCGEWPLPRTLLRPTVTVPGPDTWQPNHHEETA